MTKWDRNQINKTLKVSTLKLEPQMWAYYKTLTSQDRNKISRYMGHPTVSTIEAWFRFWQDKITLRYIDIEYYNYVVAKKAE